MVFDRATKLEGLPHDKGRIILIEDEVIAYVPNRGAVVVNLNLDDKIALLRHAAMLVSELADMYIDSIASKIAELERKLDEKLAKLQQGVFDYLPIAVEDTRILIADIKNLNRTLDRLYKALDSIGALADHLNGIEITIHRARYAMHDVKHMI